MLYVLAVTTGSGYSCCDLELYQSGEGPSGFSGYSVAKTPRKPITATTLGPWTPKST